MPEIRCLGENLYIVDKKPQKFTSVELEGDRICLKKEGGELLAENSVLFANEIFVCLHCKELKNITMVVKREEIFTASLLLKTEEVFEQLLDAIKTSMPGIRMSVQNKKINGYAAALTGKLREGVTPGVIDTEEKEDILCCPVCGMQCEPSIPYCMECGASV